MIIKELDFKHSLILKIQPKTKEKKNPLSQKKINKENQKFKSKNCINILEITEDDSEFSKFESFNENQLIQTKKICSLNNINSFQIISEEEDEHQNLSQFSQQRPQTQKIINIFSPEHINVPASKFQYVPSPSLLLPSAANQVKCKCVNSECSKLYCECFANGNFCGENCKCQNCKNTKDNEKNIVMMKQQIKLKNPTAFKQKVIVCNNNNFLNQNNDSNSILQTNENGQNVNINNNNILQNTPSNKSQSNQKELSNEILLNSNSNNTNYQVQGQLSPNELIKNLQFQFQDSVNTNPSIQNSLFERINNQYNSQNFIDLQHTIQQQQQQLIQQPPQYSQILQVFDQQMKKTENITSSKQNKMIKNHFKKQDIKQKVNIVGCNCKNSNCLRNYCECFKNGAICSKLCNCKGCLNSIEVQNTIGIDKKQNLVFQKEAKLLVKNLEKEQQNKQKITDNQQNSIIDQEQFQNQEDFQFQLEKLEKEDLSQIPEFFKQQFPLQLQSEMNLFMQ